MTHESTPAKAPRAGHLNPGEREAAMHIAERAGVLRLQPQGEGGRRRWRQEGGGGGGSDK